MAKVYVSSNYSKDELQQIEKEALSKGKEVAILHARISNYHYNNLWRKKNLIIIKEFTNMKKENNNIIYDNIKFVLFILLIFYGLSNINLMGNEIKAKDYTDIQYKEYMNELSIYN